MPIRYSWFISSSEKNVATSIIEKGCQRPFHCTAQMPVFKFMGAYDGGMSGRRIIVDGVVAVLVASVPLFVICRTLSVVSTGD